MIPTFSKFIVQLGETCLTHIKMIVNYVRQMSQGTFFMATLRNIVCGVFSYFVLFSLTCEISSLGDYSVLPAQQRRRPRDLGVCSLALGLQGDPTSHPKGNQS